jgi:hypothetical protein
MKKILLLCILSFFLLNVSAQRTSDVGFASGVVNYVGDLGNERYFPISSASRGYQITFRNFLNNPALSGAQYKPLSLELRFSWHRLQYDETDAIGSLKGNHLRNYLRGLNFRNDLIGATVNFTYTFYHNKYVPLNKQKFCYFLLAGVGVFHGTPRADLFHGSADMKNRYYAWSDGTLRDAPENSRSANVIKKDGDYETDLRSWMTEGQGYNPEVNGKKPYSLTNIGFPIGFGIRYGLSKKVTCSAEFDYYYFLTDYLDDVSGRYASYDELKTTFTDPQKFEIAKYISDPTGFGTDQTTGVGTSPRGNPKKNDSYTFISLEVSYKLLLKKKGLWTNLSMR